MIRHPRARILTLDREAAIQARAERFGRDHPETVKLTGFCRNPIRTWAEL
jgi:predicted 2-oxoglutarate/Fe(II)-dependent dioxygenase YbiX